MKTIAARLPKRVIRSFTQTIADYNLIGEGDRVLLGLSGGKDSLTLAHLLLRAQRRAPFKFEFLAVTIDYGMGEDLTRTAAHCAEYGIPYHIEKTNIFEAAPNHIREGSSFCSYFSRMRRGALYSFAEKNGYETLALAHHLDDAAESFFMSLFYGGKMRSMPPVYYASDHKVKIIRPLIKTREAQLAECAKENGFPIVGDENCPAFQMNVKMPRVRYETKAWLKELESKKAGLFNQFRHAFETLDAKSFADRRYI
ncbi:MAG: tRNA 2-thiocytidine biosynthesis protein TtcA [Helicobacteraceae bacterium]|jgi:tRNA(Ile)-lysidine synthetase-like protein|nr:tRNA 2-thiocytidine biosynthesis protein TtcA [Helicobacteraceae bacterium]